MGQESGIAGSSPPYLTGLENKVVAGATISSEIQKHLLYLLIVGRIQCLMVIGLKSQFPCLLLARNHSQFLKTVCRAITWPPPLAVHNMSISFVRAEEPISAALNYSDFWNHSIASSLFKGLT